MIKKLLILVFLSLYFFQIHASHIIGGDFTVQHIDGNTFEVELTLFRDCDGTGTLDDPITIAVYEEGTNLLMSDLTFEMEITSVETEVELGNACFTPSVCLDIGKYIKEITLPDNPNGFYLVYERCCRNASVTNIVNSFDAGMAFIVTVPDPAIQNSSPQFGPFPVDGYLAVNYLSQIDFSATDADGDSLVYRLETPLNGASTQTNWAPVIGSPKPHQLINWQAPYSLDNIVGGAPAMSIDSETGIISAVADQLGFFVFAIAVDEYRDGQLIGIVRREIQLTSELFAPPAPPEFVGFTAPQDTIEVYPIINNEETITVSANFGESGEVIVEASVSGEILEDDFMPQAFFADSVVTGDGSVSLQFNWDSIPCDYIDEYFLLEFAATSTSECLDSTLHNTLELWVHVIVDPDVSTNYISPVLDSYDLVYGQGDTYTFPVTATDGNPTDTLTLSMISDIDGVNPIEFQGDTANSFVNSNFSWEIECEDIRDDPYFVTFQTITTYCLVQDTTDYLVELNVKFPIDDPTEYVRPESTEQWWPIDGEEHCFSVRVKDDNNIDTLILSVDRSAPIFSLGSEVIFSDTSGTIELESDFCWTPNCENIEPGVYELDFNVITKNCDIIQETPLSVSVSLYPESDGTLDMVPNVFTPNGDEYNDEYEILYTPDYCVTNYNIQIFNRWGNLVFESTDRDRKWPGQFNGNDVSEGVYYLIVSYEYFGDPTKVTETIHLLKD